MSWRRMDTSGFTLIELMLAMSIFSLVFILTTVGFVGINRTYTRGVIKKDLSQSVQRVVDAVEANFQSSDACPSISGFCGDEIDGGGYNALCANSGSGRFVWHKPLNDMGGLYFDTKGCTESLDSSSQQLLDDRYVVEALDVQHLTTSHSLIRITGVFRTADHTAFTDTASNATFDRSAPGFDPFNLRCKGTAAGSVVQTCAIEKFDIVVGNRGDLKDE